MHFIAIKLFLSINIVNDHHNIMKCLCGITVNFKYLMILILGK